MHNEMEIKKECIRKMENEGKQKNEQKKNQNEQ